MYLQLIGLTLYIYITNTHFLNVLHVLVCRICFISSNIYLDVYSAANIFWLWQVNLVFNSINRQTFNTYLFIEINTKESSTMGSQFLSHLNDATIVLYTHILIIYNRGHPIMINMCDNLFSIIFESIIECKWYVCICFRLLLINMDYNDISFHICLQLSKYKMMQHKLKYYQCTIYFIPFYKYAFRYFKQLNSKLIIMLYTFELTYHIFQYFIIII